MDNSGLLIPKAGLKIRVNASHWRLEYPNKVVLFALIS